MRVSRETTFDSEIVINTLDAETGGTWDCTRIGLAGEKGCFQLMPDKWKDVDPMDFEASLRYFISKYKAGYGWWWTSANCYAYMTLFVKLPRMAQILPNTPPSVGVVAIFQYSEKHIALVTSLEEKGFWVKEANFEPAKIGKRFIQWNDPRLVGFWSGQRRPPTSE